jgi:hypothetical protein
MIVGAKMIVGEGTSGAERDLIAEVRAMESTEQFGILVGEISEIAPELEQEVIGAAREEWKEIARDIFAAKRVAAAEEFEFDPETPQWFRDRERARKRAAGVAEALKAELTKAELARQAQEKVRKFTPPSTTPQSKSILDRTGHVDPTGRIGRPDIPDAPLAPLGASQLDRLTYPRGLLGHVTQYMVDTSPLPHRWLSLASALCALAKGLDRKVIGPSGTSTVLYILLAAETGAGKQQALQSIRMTLRAMGIGNVIAAGALASVQAIEEIVEETPSALVVIDEVGAWLNRISAGGQVGNVAEIPGTLQSLWAWSPEDEWIGTKRKGKDMVTVFGPALAIFGDSTEAKLIKGLTKEEIANGFLNRWLLFDIGRGAPKRIKPKYEWTKFPTSLEKLLKQVVGKPAPEKGLRKLVLPAPDGTETVIQDLLRVGWGSGVEELWLAFEEETRARPVKERELWIRAPEQAVRLATIVAVYRGSLIVEVEDWHWAKAVVDYSMALLIRSLDKHQREKLEQVDLVERIRDEFLRDAPLPAGRTAGELTEGQIRKLCERLCDDYRRIDLAIAHLAKTGEIETFVPNPARRGPPTTHYRYRE